MKNPLTLIVFIISTLIASADTADSTIEVIRNYHVKELNRASSIVLCEFKARQGMVVTRVIRGDKKLKGQLWNSSGFPNFPNQTILAYEILNDHIGSSDRAASVLCTGHYLYDKATGDLYEERFTRDKQKVIHRVKILVLNLKDLESTLKKEKAEQESLNR